MAFRNYVQITIALLLASPQLRSESIDFDRDIRPILSDKCFQCHGPDAKTREADLRLDTKQGAFADLGGYSAFRPGDLAKSEGLRRVLSDDDDEQMPPPDSKLVLSTAQKEKLRKWVEQGAKWDEHWSFRPLERPELPEVRLSGWPKNGIDYFVLSRIEQAGLQPSPEASREKLIRRVTLDLTGLPPTPEEVDAFLADKSAGAYEKVVDRLLRSHSYGERMAWEWLDAARYADTDGFQGDPTRTMWPWRDWLIKALNDNMPFDQFTIEMLAGDLLPKATPEQIIATGFNRNHMYNGEGGRIAEETRVENVFDRTETTSTVWLGLTMTCARCHDHKFDPFTQQEYYQLFAFFNNTSESGSRGGGKAPPTVQYQSPEQREKLEGLEARIAELKKQMQAPMPDVDRAQKKWETELASELKYAKPTGLAKMSPWSVLGTLPAPGENGAKAFTSDFGPEKGVDLSRKYQDGKTAWRTEAKFIDGKVHELPSIVGATYLYRTIESPDERTIDLSLGSDDGIKVWLNGKQVLAKNVARAAAADQEKLGVILQSGRNELLMKIVNTGGIGGFYFKKTGESVKGLSPEIVEVLLTDADARTDSQRKLLQSYYRQRHWDGWKGLNASLAKLEGQRSQLQKAAVTVMVMDDLPANRRRKTAILFKGIYNKPGKEVIAGTPAFLPPLPTGAPRNRLSLARWLVDPANPLPARVTVNRYWQTFFGKGLVATTEDFGRQGRQPTHPQLLDWLAMQFVESGWNVKAIHKLMVMSATYRQSSKIARISKPAGNSSASSDGLGRQTHSEDPENLLLARAPRYRMPSWMLRDQALAVSGLLVDRVGGPPVKPYQPAGIWAEATFGKIRYSPDSGEKLYRRSLYTFWRRIVGPTMFFDSGKRQTCEVKPTRTNTPLHALTLLNETTFVEASRTMAQRLMKLSSPSTEDRITYAFRLATSRMPNANELDLLVARWEKLKAEFAKQPDQAKELLLVGQSPRDESLDTAMHAAYTVVCSLLLNLDEALTRE